MKECTGFLFLLMCGLTYSAPSKDSSFVVSSAGPSKENGKERSSENPLPFPVIYEMDISSNISNRFAKTLVLSKVKNSQNAAKETTFTVVLPEKAFISEFVMEIDGKSYKAYVKEKEEARRDYDRALASGQSAGHVAVSARDSNKFTVSINVEPEAKATFLLTYEELLERKNEQYELVLNINPGQIVKRLNLEVHINESRPLRFVTTPSLRSGNEISKNEEKLDPSSDIQIINTTTAVVTFSPDSDRQKEFAKDLGGKESEGLSGQFVVQYDVERDPNGGEVLLEDGYFIHFFAPSNLDPLPKHVLFVLDTSGSMGGTKITQLKEAMKSILDEIKTGDIINIIEFDSEVNIWDIDNKNKTNVALSSHYDNPFSVLSEQNLPEPVSVTNETIYNAKNIIDELAAYGGTNIIAGLESALYLVKVGQESKSASTDKRFQPLIIFLTDGDPNVGIGSTEEIVRLVTKLNTENHKIPIFSLSFGNGADKGFLRKLSGKNQGFSRHIYEASDSSLQLQDFYKQISSPLLSNVNFKYESGDSFPSSVNCWGPNGPINLRPTIRKPVTSLERLWAYLTVKQTLAKRDSVENKTELTKKALDLALKYSFVTDVTSLVVVKPNDTSAVDTENAASEDNPSYNSFPASASISHRLSSGFLRSSPKSSYSRDSLAYPMSASASASYSPDFSAYSMSASALYSPAFAFGGMSRPSYQAFSGYSQGLSGFNGRNYLTTIPPRPLIINNVRPNVPDPMTRLSWLKTALNSNGTLTIGQGTYEIGSIYVSGTISSHPECPRTPLISGQTGECTLLADCPTVYPLLTSLQVYQQYFCSLDNRYAGVCCPKRPNP